MTQAHPAVSSSVVTHHPRTTGAYIGSPSLLRLDDETLLASHDYFGPRTLHNVTVIHASTDDGLTWTERSRFHPAFWGSLFRNGQDLYFLSVDREYGNLVIRRSTDEGHTWTEPLGEHSGVLHTGRQFHRAPVTVTEHGGRLYTAVEDADHPTTRAATRYKTLVASAAADADLLHAASWTFTERPLVGDPGWLEGNFDGWLEGNLVATDGGLVNALRVNTVNRRDERIALVKVDASTLAVSLDPDNDLIELPGGSKKFTLRMDDTGTWWTIVNAGAQGDPAMARNRAVLASSADLRRWTLHDCLLSHPDHGHHAFQYIDCLIEGEDLLFLSRTADDDSLGGAANFHDANYLTFHRLRDFKNLRRDRKE